MLFASQFGFRRWAVLRFSRIVRATCAIWILCCLGPFVAIAQLSGVKDGSLSIPGAIEGRFVVSPDSGKSIEGVVVLLYETGAISILAADGAYRFENVPPGVYTLIAAGEGFSRLKVTDVLVKPNRRVALNEQEIPIIIQDGAVQLLETFVVSATKQVESLEEFDVMEFQVEPFSAGNVDIPRTRDDPQPRYFFGASEIARSGALDIEEFVRRRVPMNVTKQRLRDITGVGGGIGAADSKSSIDLNGFGPRQTLILINGRRQASVPMLRNQLGPDQPDINGIPLAAIERIEVLPASASAIYGADAAGGVLNIVLRHDYEGTELLLNYENAYDTDAASRRASLTHGQAFNLGRTNLLLSLSYSDADPLRHGDRASVINGYRARAWRNDPGALGVALGSSLPLGATTNIVAEPTVRWVEGQMIATPGELFGPGSSDRTHVPAGYAGGGGLAPFVANAGNLNLQAPPLAVGSSPYFGTLFALSKHTETTALLLNVRHELGERFEVFSELGRIENWAESLNETGVIEADLPKSAPTNPFGTNVRITTPLRTGMGGSREKLLNVRSVFGFKFRGPQDWVIQGDAALSDVSLRSKSVVLNFFAVQEAVARGEIDVLKDLIAYPPALHGLRNHQTAWQGATLATGTLRAVGPVFRSPAGIAVASAAVGWARLEENESTEIQVRPGWRFGELEITQVPRMAQETQHAQVELQIPVVGGQSRLRGIRELELQLGGRTERYTVEGVDLNRADVKYQASSFVAGFSYRPLDTVVLRMSTSSAYTPPSFGQLKPTLPPLPLEYFPTGWLTTFVTDPRRGGDFAESAYSYGGNPGLRPETSRNVSWGVVIEPAHVPGLRLSIDHVTIRKNDAIVGGIDPQLVVNNETSMPGRVTRNPPVPGDPYGIGTIRFIDARMMNVSKVWTETYNVAVDYVHRSRRWGSWRGFLVTNSWQHFQTKLSQTHRWLEHVNTGDIFLLQQPKFTSSAGVDWIGSRWSAGWSVRHYGKYRVSDTYSGAQGGSHVADQLYHDVYVAYAFPQRPSSSTATRLWSGVSVQVGAKNVFDTPPAFEASNVRHYYSGLGDIRMGTWYVTLRKRF